VKQPHVRTLAAELSDALDQAQAATSKPVTRLVKVSKTPEGTRLRQRGRGKEPPDEKSKEKVAAARPK
jgi:hypothetical protein